MDFSVRKQIGAEQAAIDVVHNALARSIYEYPTTLSVLSKNGERYLAIRKELLPEGVAAATNLFYSGPEADSLDP